ncbi:hypothetical protein EF908_13995 [Streptomyces sp. WAC04770]|nr:hypothetical protein EF908_13995 [Streptomyces sp. WAC04770]
MKPPAPTQAPWAVLCAGAAVCVLAALVGPRAELSLVAGGLGLAAVAAYGAARVRAALPCAAVAWLGAGCVSGILSWGLEDFPFGYGVGAVQFFVGMVLLPGHVRRSARLAAVAQSGRPER